MHAVCVCVWVCSVCTLETSCLKVKAGLYVEMGQSLAVANHWRDLFRERGNTLKSLQEASAESKHLSVLFGVLTLKISASLICSQGNQQQLFSSLSLSVPSSPILFPSPAITLDKKRENSRRLSHKSKHLSQTNGANYARSGIFLICFWDLAGKNLILGSMKTQEGRWIWEEKSSQKHESLLWCQTLPFPLSEVL